MISFGLGLVISKILLYMILKGSSGKKHIRFKKNYLKIWRIYIYTFILNLFFSIRGGGVFVSIGGVFMSMGGVFVSVGGIFVQGWHICVPGRHVFVLEVFRGSHSRSFSCLS